MKVLHWHGYSHEASCTPKTLKEVVIPRLQELGTGALGVIHCVSRDADPYVDCDLGATITFLAIFIASTETAEFKVHGTKGVVAPGELACVMLAGSNDPNDEDGLLKGEFVVRIGEQKFTAFHGGNFYFDGEQLLEFHPVT
jgi:hypothetical protein